MLIKKKKHHPGNQHITLTGKIMQHTNEMRDINVNRNMD